MELLLTGVALGFLVTAIGVSLYNYLKQVQGYAREEQIESLLSPYILTTIVASYALGSNNLDELLKMLDGIDKDVFAKGVYEYIPEPIKIIYPEQAFVELVQRTYVSFKNFFVLHREDMEEAFKKFVEENEYKKMI